MTASKRGRAAAETRIAELRERSLQYEDPRERAAWLRAELRREIGLAPGPLAESHADRIRAELSVLSREPYDQGRQRSGAHRAPRRTISLPEAVAIQAAQAAEVTGETLAGFVASAASARAKKVIARAK